MSWSDFRSTTNTDKNQFFGSIRPGVTYQILRPWKVSVAYAYERTHFTDDAVPDIGDHRLLLGTQFALRDWLFLGLSYRYASRRMDGNTAVNTVTDFTRNQFSLTVTANPNFRF
jgi:opacity protein-like surface antigen